MRKIYILLLTAVCCAVLGGCWFRVDVKLPENTASESETAEQTSTSEDAPDVPVGEKIDITEPVITTDYEMLSKYGLNFDVFARKPRTFDDTLQRKKENDLYITDRMCNSFDYFTTIEAVYVKRENQTVNLCCYLADRQSKKAKEIVFKVDEDKKRISPSQYVCAEGDYHMKGFFSKEQSEKLAFDYTDLKSEAVANKARALLHTPLLNQVDTVSDEARLNSGAETDDIMKYVDVAHMLKQDISEIEEISYNAYIPRHNCIGLINTEEHYHPWYFCLYKIKESTDVSVTVDNSKNELIIKGKYSDYNTHSHTYTAEINKDNGVMLNRVEKNGSGDVVEEINTIMVAIDCEIDQSVFDKLELPSKDN